MMEYIPDNYDLFEEHEAELARLSRLRNMTERKERITGMNDIKLLVEQNAGKISFNYEETKAFLEEKMSEYDGAYFSDETMKYAKGEVAFLRKLKTQMDTERKKVKAAWMVPYEEFKAKVDDLLLLVDKPINLIDGQIKDYERRKKEEKRDVCRKIYEQEIGDMAEYLPFERIFDEKWLNATTAVKTITDEIRNRVQTTTAQVNTIKMMESEAVGAALELYRKTLDITAAINHINSYEAQKRKILEQERARQAAEENRRLEEYRERICREERERIRKEGELAQAARQEAAKEVVKELKEVSQEVKETSAILPDSVTALYAVTATEEELQELEMTMTSLGICFERKG